MIVSYHLVLRTGPAVPVDQSSLFVVHIYWFPLLVAHVVWYLESMDVDMFQFNVNK